MNEFDTDPVAPQPTERVVTLTPEEIAVAVLALTRMRDDRPITPDEREHCYYAIQKLAMGGRDCERR